MESLGKLLEFFSYPLAGTPSHWTRTWFNIVDCDWLVYESTSWNVQFDCSLKLVTAILESYFNNYSICCYNWYDSVLGHEDINADLSLECRDGQGTDR